MAEYATSIDIRATPSEVFEYLVTPEGMTAWMGQHAELDPRPGGTFAVDIAGSPIRGEFVEIDRPHRVVVTWGLAGSADFPPGASTVSFTLSSASGGTRVDVVHSGLPDDRVEGHVDGWAHFLPRLQLAAHGEPVADDDWKPRNIVG
jgi:uncharacterized protein YndB with AHSA1/START domain